MTIPVSFVLSCGTVTFNGVIGDTFASLSPTSLFYWFDLFEEMYCDDITQQIQPAS
ncbi:MAG: hypothetical protein JST94_02360 [Bacteroidetes bacterium]|nr:hypothetical protein [Bacteroidota bacterium]MBS1670289.1 hypothetical protein [Bacteroidota bacterium]